MKPFYLQPEVVVFMVKPNYQNVFSSLISLSTPALTFSAEGAGCALHDFPQGLANNYSLLMQSNSNSSLSLF